MEAGFLGAAAAPEPQVRPDRMEQKRARPVLNAPPAIRGRRDFPGVDSGKNLHAAAAASHSERCGHGHGETVRARTHRVRSARPLHPSRTPFPTPASSRSSLTCAQTHRVYDTTSMAQRWPCGYSGGSAQHACMCGAACEGRKATLSVWMSHVLCDMCPSRRACRAGLANVRSAIDHIGQVWLQACVVSN